MTHLPPRHLSAILLTCGVTASALAAPISYTGGTYSKNFDSHGLPTQNFDSNAITWTNQTTVPGWYAFLKTSGSWEAYDTIAGNNGNWNVERLASMGTSEDSDRALGGRQYGEDVHIGATFVNNTATTLTEFTLTHTGEQWKSHSSLNQDLLFEYAIGAASHTDAFTNVPELEFVLPDKTGTGTIDGNLAANRTTLTKTITPAGGWASGQTLWIRWRPENISQGAYPAIDDVSFTAIPEPGSLALLAAGGLLILPLRRRAA